MRISDWSSDVCSSDLLYPVPRRPAVDGAKHVAIARPCIENIERPARRAGNRAFQPVERRPMGERQPVDERQMPQALRSEEHTSELQSLMRISYAVFCLKKKKNSTHNTKISLK